jgi:hypothetical protein
MNNNELLIRSTINKAQEMGIKIPTEPSVIVLDTALFLIRCLFALGPYILPQETIRSPIFDIASKFVITMPLYCSFPQIGLKPSLLQSEALPDIIEEP